jgi:hypothetical protein
MLTLWDEAKDLVVEHSAAGDSLAGDDAFLKELARRGVTLWLAQPSGGFAKVKREGQRWVPEKVGDPAVLAGGKEQWWDRMEPVVRAGHVRLPSRDHGRVTCDWVRDRAEGRDDAERQGFVTELARAHPDGVVDRADEVAIAVAWFATCAPSLSSWGYARKAG